MVAISNSFCLMDSFKCQVQPQRVGLGDRSCAGQKSRCSGGLGTCVPRGSRVQAGPTCSTKGETRRFGMSLESAPDCR